MSRDSSTRSPLLAIFVGEDGLRCGWRFLLFVMGIELASRFVEAPVGLYLAKRLGVSLNKLSAPALMLEEFVGFGVVLLVTGAAALLERRRIDSYGLPINRAFGLYFWKGMLAGFLVVAFIGGAMLLTGGMQIHGFAVSGTTALYYTFLWLGAMVLVGLNEEYLFRGYSFQSLWRGGGFWPAAIITTAIFAGLHLSKPHENAMDITMIFIGGMALCVSVWRTGTLWWAVGWHTAFDFGQFFIIGTRNGGQTPAGHLLNVTFPGPDWITGGQLGTEASAFMVPAVIATLIYAGWFLRRPNKSESPQNPPRA